ncbi:hypothetical protein ASPZODRAFT_134509 [Penicilliopsis zonata CBS 506.65]|uniref:RRM domain-containing protein n=1 Tax=Penicilliopsis zonata CBS 506.65 TaxID=1073090 RepID=A0A1L9SD77_9EURO|nr:hypothetical protein ASPZODRAFT_134509 [Penicilliopsis zonata CBS 506.65]OJJ45082.1 hypothetical protein ASPZODRAFT_134509 [Penicilliopsis zonata CBS 506.65]
MTQGPGKSPGGVLQISAAATQKNATSAPSKPAKPPTPRLKLLVRRLPPGLTQAEFESALGDEWKTGAGKVDWLQYKPGKVSKDAAKPSRPSRAYIHVVANEHLAPLSDTVRTTSFLDARNTVNDPVLMGPPTLEFAPYSKVPGSRVRKDARQGTIDQDPDFIAFLESLTQPITKPTASADAAADGGEKRETMITPLVQYIKDKKANKAKENAAAAKAAKHAKGDREGKAEKVQAKKLLQRPDKDVSSTSDKKSRADKTTKEAVKAASKQAASIAAKAAGGKTSAAAAATATTNKDTGAGASSDRKRDRGNASAAAKIVQRDLGLSPASGGRRRGGKGSGVAEGESPRDRAATPTEKKDVPLTKSTKGAAGPKTGKESATMSRAASDAGGTPSLKGTGPAASTAKSSKPGRGKKEGAATQSPVSTATQAFLKHANPSQGVTEALLETAFAPFGTVTKVEIDKKKGFGYVDFAEPESLQKAIAASPVAVAQSQVVVLERKATAGGADKGGGGGGGGRGGKGSMGTSTSGVGKQDKDNKEGRGKSGGGGTASPATSAVGADAVTGAAAPAAGGASRGSRGRGRHRGGGSKGNNAKASETK